jgi:hypothetical protein
MLDSLGLAGILLVFAGLHLMWRARHEILYWVDRYLLLFRSTFDQSAGRREPWPASPQPREGRSLLELLAGVGMMVLGLSAATLFLVVRLFF